MIFRFMQKLPIAFLQSPCMVSLLECALASVSLDHKDANASVMKFFHEILNFDDKDEVNIFNILYIYP